MAGSTNAGADTSATCGENLPESSNRIQTADNLVRLSTDEILEFDDETVSRPFNHELGRVRRMILMTSTAPRSILTVVRLLGNRPSTMCPILTAFRRQLTTRLSKKFWVEGDAKIDMTDVSVALAGGVTLASDRGRDESEGALLHQDENGFNVFISTGGDDGRHRSFE